jgi:hypothetical protein
VQVAWRRRGESMENRAGWPRVLGGLLSGGRRAGRIRTLLRPLRPGSLRRREEEMRIRTGALAVLVAAVVLTAFCADTTSLAAAAPAGDAAGAWAAPDRMAVPKGADRRIGSASDRRRRSPPAAGGWLHERWPGRTPGRSQAGGDRPLRGGGDDRGRWPSHGGGRTAGQSCRSCAGRPAAAARVRPGASRWTTTTRRVGDLVGAIRLPATDQRRGSVRC